MIKPIKDIDNVELSEQAPKSKLKKAMPEQETIFQKINRLIRQRTTQAALSLFATIAGALWAGVDIDVEVLTKSLTGIVTGIAGIYALGINIYNMFTDDEAG